MPRRRSISAMLLAMLASALPLAAVTVRFDFNTASSNTLTGWTAANSGNGNDGTVFVTTSAFGSASVAVRDRNNGNTDGPGGDTANNDMWRDFVFADHNNSANGSGLTIAITGLIPNTSYPITIWGYDASSSSSVPRVADWSGGGGSGVLSFNPGATNDPTSLSDHSFVTFNATSNGSGQVTLTGEARAAVDGGSSSHDVFVNGLEIGDAIPEPSAMLLTLGGLGLALRRRRD